MKRHTLLAHLHTHGCQLLREGGKHSIYVNPVKKLTSSVPRHTEVANRLAAKICKDLGIPQP